MSSYAQAFRSVQRAPGGFKDNVLSKMVVRECRIFGGEGVLGCEACAVTAVMAGWRL